MQQKIVTFLTFDGRAEEAVEFYTSVFENSRILSKSHYGAAGPGPEGSLMMASFELEGQQFTALNGDSSFEFSHGISLFVRCQTQAEVDELWDKLTADGGEPVACGWLKDKFGVSWQIIPNALPELLSDPDREKAGRVMMAMMDMVKIDVEGLRRAYDGA